MAANCLFYSVKLGSVQSNSRVPLYTVQVLPFLCSKKNWEDTVPLTRTFSQFCSAYMWLIRYLGSVQSNSRVPLYTVKVLPTVAHHLASECKRKIWKDDIRDENCVSIFYPKIKQMYGITHNLPYKFNFWSGGKNNDKNHFWTYRSLDGPKKL